MKTIGLVGGVASGKSLVAKLFAELGAGLLGPHPARRGGLAPGGASGKSLVAKLFAELGAGLLDADRAGHEVLAHDGEVRQAVVDRWGPSVLAAEGSIDRAAVAACVFAADAESASDRAATERKFLRSLLPPRIG